MKEVADSCNRVRKCNLFLVNKLLYIGCLTIFGPDFYSVGRTFESLLVYQLNQAVKSFRLNRFFVWLDAG